MRAELKVLDKLNEDIDQLSSDARDCSTIAPEVKTLLDLAWYFAEKAAREVHGHCSVHVSGWCACCNHFKELQTKAERIGRSL